MGINFNFVFTLVGFKGSYYFSLFFSRVGPVLCPSPLWVCPCLWYCPPPLWVRPCPSFALVGIVFRLCGYRLSPLWVSSFALVGIVFRPCGYRLSPLWALSYFVCAIMSSRRPRKGANDVSFLEDRVAKGAEQTRREKLTEHVAANLPLPASPTALKEHVAESVAKLGSGQKAKKEKEQNKKQVKRAAKKPQFHNENEEEDDFNLEEGDPHLSDLFGQQESGE